MHPLIIIGIILVAVGTGLTIFGGVLQNRVDSVKTTQIVTEKIDNAMEKMSELKSEDTVDITQAEEVLDEFSEWAEEFLSNRGAKKLEIERARLSTLEDEIKQTNKTRVFLGNSFSTIEGILLAYSKQSGDPIDIQLPSSIPENVYRAKCEGIIKFSDDVEWKVQVSARSASEEPSFLIFSDSSFLLLSVNNDKVNPLLQGQEFRLTNHHEKFELSDKEALGSVLRDIIENRIYDMTVSDADG